MEKLKFEFAVIPKPDDIKTNIYGLLSIIDTQNNKYNMPKKYEPINLHEELIKENAFEMIKKLVNKRHEKREVWINLTSEIEKVKWHYAIW